MVDAVIKILQFDLDGGDFSIQDIVAGATNDGVITDIAAGVSSDHGQHHLPAIQNPVPGNTPPGWNTEDKEDWSDSPTRQPNLLYRFRYGWGRDKLELFQQVRLGIFSVLAPGADGVRWGNMDDASGLLIYDELFGLSTDGTISDYTVEDSATISDKDFNISGSATIRDIGGVSGEVTLEQFPFLLVAEPEPFSLKNPVDTDVFIRLANFTNPLASGTITLYLDDVAQSQLEISEFFSGLGGFNVTWNNAFSFDYDVQVDVRWEFDDTDVPANHLVVAYPFFTVSDLSGPRITNVIPTDQSTSVSVSSFIQFDVEDFETDVDITSLVLYVNNVLAVDGDNGTLVTTRLNNQKGYTVKFTPEAPWLYGDLIPVALFIKDASLNKNETFFTYSFTTEESIAPRLINIVPAKCTVQVPVGADISVDVIDGGHGLNKDTIVFTVDKIERGETILLIPIVHRDD